MILDTCGNGQIEAPEECELGSEYCVNCFCTDGSVSDGKACYIGLNPGQLAGIIVACVGAPLLAGAIALIVLAKQGKLKKKEKLGSKKLPESDMSHYRAIDTTATNSSIVTTTSNTEAG